MRRELIVGMFGVLATAACAQTPDAINTAISKLAHARYVEREKAACELESAGAAALPALKQAATSADPEVRQRAQALIVKIERAVTSERLLTAPKLTIKLQAVPLQQAVAEVAKQSGLRLVFEPGKEGNPQRTVTVDTGELPYWEALQAFFAAAGITETEPMPAPEPTSRTRLNGRIVVQSGRSGAATPAATLKLTDGKASNAVAAKRALRVRVLPASYADNKYDAATGEVTFHVDIDGVPTLEIREVFGVEIRRAIGDRRQALAPVYVSAPFQPIFSGEQMLIAKQVIVLNGEMLIDDGLGERNHLPIVLKTDDPRPRRLAEVEGVVAARVVAPATALVSIADVFGAGVKGTQEAYGLSLSVVGVDDDKIGDRATLRLRVASSIDSINEFLNFPVQVRGRVRPFIRINRGGNPAPAGASEFSLTCADHKPIKIVSTRVVGATTDGQSQARDVELQIVKPANGLKGINLAIIGRRQVVVDMPFVLHDVLLP